MALQVGDVIPHFTAKDAQGNDFDSHQYIGKKPLVIYFYPRDNTPGCTAQACSFRDQYEDFTDLGAEVIGISSDTATSHDAFAKRYKLPFILIADVDKSIRKRFGVPTGLFGVMPGRVTYVTDKKGVIILIFDNSLMATKHIPKALAAIKKLVS
ncbi:peroxiredoxin [Flavobacterium restrictum]|uniref:thioredoxin-dependent peroxiredoxin n=1 Tax=Flavobacterium restrictum TaxID=2594428 RepID=A0A553DS66_9FLAO|nr:peroxiredoxin [Flavobacterium restrictum]TRX35621.1 peroxiredoxin [Flavobacterium restrictum]